LQALHEESTQHDRLEAWGSLNTRINGLKDQSDS
jgi:hypothetical protein